MSDTLKTTILFNFFVALKTFRDVLLFSLHHKNNEKGH